MAQHKPRFRRERLANVLKAFADAGQPVLKVRLPDGTEILAGADTELADADEGLELEQVMRDAMPARQRVS